jgi:FKBP-type peptidyl-prolyl cis-trans isomerase 2
MDWETIANDAEQKILEATGGHRGDRIKYIKGLENVISNLECSLMGAKEDQEREEAEMMEADSE